MAKLCAVLGDTSTHGGSLVATNQDNRATLAGIPICVDGCTLACPLHGLVTVASITTKSYINGKLITTFGAVAQCGAIITPVDRKFYVE